MALARLVYVLDWRVSQQAAPRNDDTGAFLAVLNAVMLAARLRAASPRLIPFRRMSGVRKDAGVRVE
jgi:hypothetical protein